MKTTKRSLAICLEKPTAGYWQNIKEFSLLSDSYGYECQIVIIKKIGRASSNPFSEYTIDEWKNLAAQLQAHTLLVNTPLAPKQQQLLETKLCMHVVDRTELLLKLFEQRAHSATGKLQVKLAQLGYQLSKLVRTWTHLERQKGGIGLRGGPGEKQLEIDRRLIRQRQNTLKRQLVKQQTTRQLHLQARKKSQAFTVALVGYTNAGKSTLFNKLTGAKSLVEDKLFATLDPLSRKLCSSTEQTSSVIITDTVGFIKDMPDVLVETFHDTLVELQTADLILHIVDINDKESILKHETVTASLKSIGASTIPTWNVYNKCDSKSDYSHIEDSTHEHTFHLSAQYGHGVKRLVYALIKASHSLYGTLNTLA